MDRMMTGMKNDKTMKAKNFKTAGEGSPVFSRLGQSLCPAGPGRRLLFLLLLGGLIFILSSCSQKVQHPVTIVTIWDAEENNGVFDFSNSPKRIQNQRRGFERGMKAYPVQTEINEFLLSEKNAVSENAKILADIYSTEDVLMSVGASSDINTMYAAMTNSFFNLSILIPFSDGDLVTSTGSDYAMRMAPLSQKYADYIGTQIFPANIRQTINSVLFADKVLPDYDINTAVFFADDFNGHETTVKITQRLIDNGLDIDYYRKFMKDELLTVFNSCWNEEDSILKDIDVLLLIGEDMDEMPDLSKILQYWENAPRRPIVLTLGYVPGSYDAALWADDQNNLFVIRQAIDMSNCPADIINHEEAIGYAAGYITQKVMADALKDAPEEPSGYHLVAKTETEKQQIHQSYITDMRSRVFTAFMSLKDDIPCFGKPMFDTSSSERRQLELIRYINEDEAVAFDPGIIQSRLIDLINAKTSASR